LTQEERFNLIRKSLIEAPEEFIKEFLQRSGSKLSVAEFIVGEQKRAYPETPIEKLATRDLSLWVIQQHLIGEYGKKGQRGLKRENLVGLPIKKGKAHWDFRFQRIDPETGKALETLEALEQDRLEYFFIDEEGRLRFVPETNVEIAEYKTRVNLSRKHSRNFKPEYRKQIEACLRRFKACDLQGVKILDAPDDEFRSLLKMSEKFVKGGGWYERPTNTCYINGENPFSKTRIKKTGISTIEHELAHSIYYDHILRWREEAIPHRGTGQPFRWTELPKHIDWKLAFAKTKGAGIVGVSLYAKTNVREAFAESLICMKNRPALTRYLMKTYPKSMKPWFEKISDETGYYLRRIKED